MMDIGYESIEYKYDSENQVLTINGTEVWLTKQTIECFETMCEHARKVRGMPKENKDA